jgi:formamidopyrimidine-DNA glycosylase
MVELPEAVTLSRQLGEALAGKRIGRVVAAHTPHGFAWYHGDPTAYPALLTGKALGRPCPRCGAPIERQAYLGGAVYTCPTACQPA